MIGPNSSGRIAASIMIGPAGLAVSDHARLSVGLRMQRDDLLKEYRFGTRDVLDRLAGHRLGKESDEVAGMAGLEGDADFAVGLEAADARAVSRARIDDDEGAARLVYLGARRRDDPGQCVVDRPCELAAINDQFDLVFQHVRRGIALCSRY